MLVVEAKLKGKTEQFEALDEAIRAAQFIRNFCLRYWIPKVQEVSDSCIGRVQDYRMETVSRA
jgi:putative transposase